MALTSFDGIVAVITGGASGIGLATAQALHVRGAHIALADINASGLMQAKDRIYQLNSDAPGQILTVATDVTDEAQVLGFMQETSATLGHIDLVITCAGIGRGGTIDTFSARDMQTMMNINFMGTYNCVLAALPSMRQQQ